MPTFSTTADGFEMRTGQPADGLSSVLIQEAMFSGHTAVSAYRFTEYVGVEIEGTFTAFNAEGWPTEGVITDLRYYVLGTPGDPDSGQLLYQLTGASLDAAQVLAASTSVWTLFALMTAGNDLILGGFDDDDLVGGAGDDTYVVDDLFDWTWEALNEGYDTVQSSASYTLRQNVERLELTGAGDLNGTGNALDNALIGNDGANLLRGLEGDDRLEGGGGDDRLDGREGIDLLFGGDGADLMSSGAEADRLWGGNGADVLLAGAGNDRLLGGGGSDRLNGGEGDDRMTGGAGRDVFVFRGASGSDVVTDFDAGAGAGDVLSLDPSVFDDFADVLAHARDTGLGLLIEKAGVAIRLTGVTLAELAADDVHFAPPPPPALPGGEWLV